MIEVRKEVSIDWLKRLENVLEFSSENTDVLLAEHNEATIDKRPFKKNRVISEMYENELELLAAVRLELNGMLKHS